MSESLDGVAIAAAIRNPGAREQYYRAINRRLLLLGNRLGLDGDFDDDPTQPATQKAPPAPVGLAVVGIDGSFEITITLPQDVPAPSVTMYQNNILRDLNKQRAQMVHQLQCASSVLFDASSNVVTYGPFTDTFQKYQLPNMTLFWRVRSSFDGTTWNDWGVYSSPTTCGPVGVASGVLRTTSNAMSNVASTPAGNISPLTQVGTTSVINVAASSWRVGGSAQTANIVPYNSGSVNVTGPGSVGPTWYVYADDPTHVGGSVTYAATLNSSDVTSFDGRLYFGSIVLKSGGGGGGGGGGAGGCLTGEVMTEMADGSQRRVDQLSQGDVLRGIDGDETIGGIEMIPAQPCFSFALDNGLTLAGCSHSHPLKYDGAGFQNAVEVHVGDVLQTKKGPGRVVRKTFIGARTVYKLALSRNRVFFTDGLASHNALLK